MALWGVELAAYASAGTPADTIESPQPGTTLLGRQTLVWSASDPADTTPLTYAVDYSADGGVTWLPLSDSLCAPLTASQFTFDADTLLGGSNIYFQVTALNGLDSGTASAGPFTIGLDVWLHAVVSSVIRKLT